MDADVKVVHVVEVAASPDDVFGVLCDVERWPEWTKTTTRVVRTDRGPFGVGSCAEVQQPRLRASQWTVTELTPGRRFVWTSTSLGLSMTAGHAVAPTATGCRVCLSLEASGWLQGLIRVFYGATIDQYVGTEALSLKAYCEGPVSAQKPTRIP